MTKFRRLSLVVAAAILTAPVWGSDSVRQTALYRQINPVPHVVEIAPEGPVLDISGGVYVVDKHGLFGSDVNFLNKGAPDGGLPPQEGHEGRSEASLRSLSAHCL